MSLIVPDERIVVCPPRDSGEPGFDSLHAWPEIERQLTEIARNKNDDVVSQLAPGWEAVLTADTVIVGESNDGALHALGQPPESDAWRETVRRWFYEFYLGKTHVAATAICITTDGGFRQERLVKTRVTMRGDAAELVDWYIDTGEPLGKAGGYALQGAGGLFVERIEGSPSNVVGLPLQETWQALQALNVDLGFAGVDDSG